ncbi:hypothetical protein E4U23_004003, partial [Claviceps purpurea]
MPFIYTDHTLYKARIRIKQERCSAAGGGKSPDAEALQASPPTHGAATRSFRQGRAELAELRSQ